MSTYFFKGFLWSSTAVASLYKQKDHLDERKVIDWYLKAAEKNDSEKLANRRVEILIVEK